MASGLDWFYDWIRKRLFPYPENIIEKIVDKEFVYEKKNMNRN